MPTVPPAAVSLAAPHTAPITIRGHAANWTLVVTPSGPHHIGGALHESTLAEAFGVDLDDTPEDRAHAAGLIEGVERMVLALASTPHFHPDAIRVAVDTVLENAANDA